MAACTIGMLSFNACNESVDLSNVDESLYTIDSETLAFVINDEGKQLSSLVELRQEGQAGIFLALSKNTESDVQAVFEYNASVLEAYNNENKTDFGLFPQQLVSFDSEVTIKKGEKKSGLVNVNFISDESLTPDKTYVIPISTKLKSGGVKLSETGAGYLLFVKDHTTIPTSRKASGIKIISCMEVNDTNPLNNLCFSLKESGKPLIDMVILFSANINYNNETGRVYVHNNENVQHLLDNRDKYIKPLQDRGMKVILGLLGNHDRSGIANLADETAREFAQELKAVCDAYQLDGVFFDDEYSAYQRPVPEGFVGPSSAAAARLCYETKQAMPDKLVCAYVYSTTAVLPDIDGHQSGTFVDYGIHDYMRGSDLSDNYPGMPKSNMALYSQEFARGYFASEEDLLSLRQDGYGSHMIFAMDPLRPNFTRRQKPAMERIASALFDDELEVFGKDGVKIENIEDVNLKETFYNKDW